MHMYKLVIVCFFTFIVFWVGNAWYVVLRGKPSKNERPGFYTVPYEHAWAIYICDLSWNHTTWSHTSWLSRIKSHHSWMGLDGLGSAAFYSLLWHPCCWQTQRTPPVYLCISLTIVKPFFAKCCKHYIVICLANLKHSTIQSKVALHFQAQIWQPWVVSPQVAKFSQNSNHLKENMQRLKVTQDALQIL